MRAGTGRSIRVISRSAVAFAATAISLGLTTGTAVAAPPANDNFANATTFPAIPGTAVGTNVEATKQTGEPDNGAATVWWKWTATETGRFRIDTCETVPSWRAVLGVYRGSSVNALTAVSETTETDCGSGSGHSLWFDAVGGTVYHFSAGSYFTSEPSQNIRLSLRSTPKNDLFSGALPFSGSPATEVGSNAEATREDGEPETGVRSVWWKWSATETARYRIDDCETVPTLRSVLGIYRGTSVSNLIKAEAGTDTCPSGSGGVKTFDAVQGTMYNFSVGSYFTSESSQNVRLSLRRTAVNDNFANASVFTPPVGTLAGDTREATHETGEPNNGTRTIWWSWTAPSTAKYRADTCQTAPAHGTHIAVFTGSPVTSLVAVAPGPGLTDCGGTNTSGLRTLTFDAVAGTTYSISVGTMSSAGGPVALRLGPPPVATGPGGTGTNPTADPVKCASAKKSVTTWTKRVKSANKRVSKTRKALKKRGLSRKKKNKLKKTLSADKKKAATAKKSLASAKKRVTKYC